MKNLKKILLILSLLYITHNVLAQDIDILQIRTELSSSNLTVNVPFTFNIYVNYDTPDDISILLPSITNMITLERFIKSPRIINSQTWTHAEYRFTAKMPGRYVLDSFTVVSPFGVSETNPITLNIQSNEAGRINAPRITWEGAPVQMKAGERAIISLRVHNWNSVTPGGEFFMYDIPEGVIMESVQNTERSSGVAVKFLLIPLEAKNISLKARTLQYENIRFEIPALRINVINAANPDGKAPDAISASDTRIDNFPAFEIPEDKQSGLSKEYRIQCGQTYSIALEFWENKLYAQSLAEMRRFERDNGAGKYLRPIRREAEEILGIWGMLNEKPSVRQIYLTLIITILIFVIIFPLGCFIILKGQVRKKAVVFCAVFCVCAELFLISRLIDKPSEDNYKSGISLGVKLRRIADLEAEGLLYLKEGFPVIIMKKSGSWLHIRTNDSDSTAGWVPEEKIIKY